MKFFPMTRTKRSGKYTLNKKLDNVKGDCIRLLEKDFAFIGISMDEEEISTISKSEYKRKIKSLVQRAVLKYLNEEKLKHRKLDSIRYTELKIQPYLVSQMSNTEKIT